VLVLRIEVFILHQVDHDGGGNLLMTPKPQWQKGLSTVMIYWCVAGGRLSHRARPCHHTCFTAICRPMCIRSPQEPVGPPTRPDAHTSTPCCGTPPLRGPFGPPHVLQTRTGSNRGCRLTVG
jgi:hypothetical protein